MEENKSSSILEFNLDYDGGNILKETVKWTRFLGIVGIVATVLLLLIFLIAGSALLALSSSLLPGVTGSAGLGLLIIVVFFGILGMEVYMLYRFSVLVKRGIESQNQHDFNKGLTCLKIFFIVWGIFAILVLLSKVISLFKLL